MSSFLAVELDALNKAPAAARAARVTEDVIIGGLLRMWAHCFREKVSTLQPLQVAGFFSAEADMVPALVAFGFLAQGEAGAVRVKGAERYLRISEGRSKGGKAASGNLKRGQKPSRSVSPGTSPAEAGAQPEQPPGSSPGFHRTPNTEHLVEKNVRTSEVEPAAVERITPAPPKRRALTIVDRSGEPDQAPEPVPVVAGPAVYEKPTTDPELWLGEDFFAWAQAKRQEAGLLGERHPPRGLSGWWSTARQTTSSAALQEAFIRFGNDPHWTKKAVPPCPFHGFLKQWERFVPAQPVQRASLRVDEDVWLELKGRVLEVAVDGGLIAQQLEQLQWSRSEKGLIGHTEDGFHANFILEKFGGLLPKLNVVGIDAPPVGGAA